MPVAEPEMPSGAEIGRAGDLLRAGRLVAFPTETVYGLGANALEDNAVLGIYEAKGRPRFNPLIVHVPDAGVAAGYGEFDARAQRLAEAFWPGPLTLVVPKSPSCELSDIVTAGLDTVALRVPRHPVSQAVLKQAGVPVAAPSANLSGTVSSTRADHLDPRLRDKIAMVLDAGSTECGLESTIVSAVPGEPLRLLRPGTVTRREISQATGEPVLNAQSGRITAPGQMRRHYAPRAPLRLDAVAPVAGEAYIAFGQPPEGTTPLWNLSPTGDLREAAATLFAALKALDASDYACAAVAPIPPEGIGEAINDRLQRAATAEDAT